MEEAMIIILGILIRGRRRGMSMIMGFWT
jgi:hypothetical protein